MKIGVHIALNSISWVGIGDYSYTNVNANAYLQDSIKLSVLDT